MGCGENYEAEILSRYVNYPQYIDWCVSRMPIEYIGLYVVWKADKYSQTFK